MNRIRHRLFLLLPVAMCLPFIIHDQGKTLTLCRPQGEPSESKAMGLCLES
jgi:hypothetical protein